MTDKPRKNYPTHHDRREKAKRTTKVATEIIAKERNASIAKVARLKALRESRA